MGGTADYAYNGLGERVSKTIMGQTKTTYYYDGADLVLEKNGTASTAYVAGPRIDEILTDSRKFSYQADGQGSVLNLTDPLGVKSNTYSYTAFGSTKAQTGAVINTWLYTGRQYDSESGLYFNRNRYYSPYLGRFITKDPIGIIGGINPYAYTQNRPVYFSDPSGLFTVIIGAGGSVTAGGGAEASGGILINPGLGGESVDVGTFISVGTGGGLGVGGDIFIGGVVGPASNVAGTTANINIGIGPASITIFNDPVSGKVIGGTLGVGPSATPLSGTLTISLTETNTVRDIIEFIDDVLNGPQNEQVNPSEAK